MDVELNRQDDATALKLVVVIVNYRTADLTIDCLASLGVPGTVPDGTRIVAVEGDPAIARPISLQQP